MNIVITSRHFELTDSIKEYIIHLGEGLKKYHLDILSFRVVVSFQEKKGKREKEKVFFD